MRKITLPIDDTVELNVGEIVYLSGTIYTARDAAHKRLMALLDEDKPLPLASGACIYYAGPCPVAPGKIIGSVGPTTSGRMDTYAPRLIAKDLRYSIGKGMRSPQVVQAIQAHGGLYFAAIGGAGALYATCVQEATPIAFEDLGAEAIYALRVKDMPLVVAIDRCGNSVYQPNISQ